MLPPGVPSGRFPRTLIDLHSSVVSVSLTLSSRCLELLLQAIMAIRKRTHVLRSSTYLDIIERIVGVKGFQYLSEAVVAVEVAFLLACILNRGVPHHDLELLRNNRLFLETIENKMPHVLHCYRTIKGFNLRSRFMECVDMFRFSPSILNRTPAEATRRHSEQIKRGRWRHPPAAGKVRLHFFRRHDPSKANFQHPDVRIDLDFDSKSGVNLRKARNLLGVERLSVITSLSPYRTTFDPVDRDKLSPLAVYDLSKQLREPIRVFEPFPSKITKIKRKIHDTASLSTYLVFTLIRSCLGFTLRDCAYIAVTFGDDFAARCAQVSNSIHPLNLWAREGALLLSQLCTFLILLPLMIFCKGAVFLVSSLSFAACGTWALLVFLTITIGEIFSSLFRLPFKAWITVLAFSWLTFADLILSASGTP